MYKGVVMELFKTYAVVFTETGQFYKIKRFGEMTKGQSLLFTEEDLYMENGGQKRQFNTALLGIIAASLLVIAVSSTWFFATFNTVYTAVLLDINPSVEIDLNKNNKVVKLVALNEDALQLSLNTLKGLEIEDAIETLVAEAGALGFIKSDDGAYVMVTTVSMKNQSTAALEQRIIAKFESSDVLQRTNIALSNITPEQLNTAKSSGIPAGLISYVSGDDKTSVIEFFKVDDNVKTFEAAGTVLRGSSVDTNTGATPTVGSTNSTSGSSSGSSSSSSSNSSSSSDDSISELTQDLRERLLKLKGIQNPTDTISNFITRADAYFNTGVGDLRTLTAEAKRLWDAVKDDDDDDRDDDSDDDSDDDDRSTGSTGTTGSTSGSTQSSTSSSTGSSSSSDSVEHLSADLAERLSKLKGVSNPSTEIKSFTTRADAYFANGTGDLAALTAEGKRLWDAVKDAADDEEDSSDDDSSDDDSSDDDSSDDDSNDD